MVTLKNSIMPLWSLPMKASLTFYNCLVSKIVITRSHPAFSSSWGDDSNILSMKNVIRADCSTTDGSRFYTLTIEHLLISILCFCIFILSLMHFSCLFSPLICKADNFKVFLTIALKSLPPPPGSILHA